MARKVKRKKSLRPKVLVGVMGLSIGLMGVSYAGWTQVLNITQRISTGEMDFVFLEKGCGVDSFNVRLAKINKKGELEKEKKPLEGVTLNYEDEDKKLNFVVKDAINLNGNGNDKKTKLICIEYQITPRIGTDILKVAPIKNEEDDRGVLLKEPVVCTLTTQSLWINEREISLPTDWDALANEPLEFNAYNKMEIIDGEMKGTLTLERKKPGQLKTNSEEKEEEMAIYDINYLDIPEEIRTDLLGLVLEESGMAQEVAVLQTEELQETLDIEGVEAKVKRTYSFTIPLAFDQFNAGYDETSIPSNILQMTTDKIQEPTTTTEEGE